MLCSLGATNHGRIPVLHCHEDHNHGDVVMRQTFESFESYHLQFPWRNKASENVTLPVETQRCGIY